MEKRAINAIRMLGVDMINKANSGHPGIVLGAAPMMYTLFTKHLDYNPKDPVWFNRDRFIMSAGHGSALLYSTLHLTGYDISMEDLKTFRQWGSNTPGHPEYGYTAGVEATTGPLGQGIAMAVGIASAEEYLQAAFNKNDNKIVDHYTYSLCGDGDLQEGVALEAISLAGHLGLSKLIVLYDSNDIQLDGPVNMANSVNTKEKFESMNWNYILVEDGEDINSIDLAISKAKQNNSKPTLIEIKTIIGHGSPEAGKHSTHGAPLGKENTLAARKTLAWEHDDFDIGADIYEHFKQCNLKGAANYDEWKNRFNQYKEKYSEKGELLNRIISGERIKVDYDEIYSKLEFKPSMATRASSGEILNALQEENLLLIGGSADLSSSTKVKGINGDFSAKNPSGRNINFGVREHAMAAIANGITLHGLRGFTGGFFIFSDYMKPAMRIAALSKLSTIFVFTHDSIAVGEDGPTHEPVEQLAAFRSMPNMEVIRPADVNEVKAAWKIALESTDTPTTIVLTRQNVPTLDQVQSEGVEKGAYIIAKEEKQLDCILIATGSEVSLTLEAKKELLKEGVDVRVVSMPSFKRFDEQREAYKRKILPLGCKKRLAIEMGSSFGWHKYIGLEGDTLTVDTFGASAKGEEIIEKYGFTVSNVVHKVKTLL